MSALAATTAGRAGAAVVVANRTRRARPTGWPPRSAAATADLGRPARRDRRRRPGHLLHRRRRPGDHRGTVRRGAGPARPARPLVLLDLALPRDVDPAVADLPGVTVIGMDELAALPDRGAAAGGAGEVDARSARSSTRRSRAYRSAAQRRARSRRPWSRCGPRRPRWSTPSWPGSTGRLPMSRLDAHALDEIARTVRRVVDKLLHAPTVRVKELAGSPGGDEYADALRVLFDLDPRDGRGGHARPTARIADHRRRQEGSRVTARSTHRCGSAPARARWP